MNLIHVGKVVRRLGKGQMRFFALCTVLMVLEGILGSLALASLLPATAAIVNPGTIGSVVPVFGPMLEPYLAAAPLAILLVLALLLIAKAIISMAMDVAGIMLGERLRVVWTHQMMRRYINDPLDAHAVREEGALISNILELPRGGQSFVVALTGYASLVFQALGILVAMALIRWEVLAAGVGVSIVGYLLLRRPYHSRAAQMGKDNISYHQLTATRIVETMRGIRDVKLLELGPVVARKLLKHLNAHKVLQTRVRILQRLPSITVELGIGCVVLLVYFLASSYSDAELKTILPEAAFFIVAFQRVITIGAALTAQNFKLINNYQRLETMANMLDEVVDEGRAATNDGSALTGDAPLTGALTLRHVNYTYPNGTPGLRDISATIPLGGVVYVFGPSGCGKSTLLDILTRLRTPQEGQVEMNGISITDYPLRRWMNVFGYVSQEPTLLRGTVSENIALFNPEVSPERVRDVARQVGADDFIVKLPEGYNTMVSRSGGTLSGGQRRRIAIARCLVRNPKILILDEALTALEESVERELVMLLRRNIPGLTIIIISHRTANSDLADHVLGFHAGRLVTQAPVSEAS